MDNDVVLLHQKIDTLTGLVAAQQHALESLSAQVSGYVAGQNMRQAEFDELKNDLIPIANQLVKLSIHELEEIGSEFQLNDLLFIGKRLLRDTRLLVSLLDRLESAVELGDDLQVVGRQAYNQAVLTLERLEVEGYFAFARGGWGVIEKVVKEFSTEDINALGDNVVSILKTVRNLTQPEIMTMTNQTLDAIRHEPTVEGEVSIWAILKDMGDPKVRKGLARLLNLVKVLAEQPALPRN